MPDTSIKPVIRREKKLPRPAGPLVVAHRGASAVAPENTLAAFRRAINAGAEGIEFDVRLAGDGVPVVHHDATLERTGRRVNRIADLTSTQLAEIDVGSWFNDIYPDYANATFADERVPTLSSTLETLSTFSGVIYIELKCRDSEVAAISHSVCDAIADSPLKPQIIIKSFKLGVIPLVRYECAGVKTAALFAPQVMRYLRKEKHLVNIAEEFGADELSLHYSLVTHKLMKKVEKRGMPVAIWTADNPRWIKRGTRLGLKAIITNDPARLLAKRTELELTRT